MDHKPKVFDMMKTCIQADIGVEILKKLGFDNQCIVDGKGVR